MAILRESVARGNKERILFSGQFNSRDKILHNKRNNKTKLAKIGEEALLST